MLAHILGTVLVYLIGKCLYRGHFHPLARYPGPFWAHYTNLWRFVAYLQDQSHLVDANLHARYGPVVRTGPSSLSFSNVDAFNAIYTQDRVFEKGAFYDFSRNPDTGDGGTFTARTAQDVREARRRLLKGGFSGPSLARYRPLISAYVSDLTESVEKALREASSERINIAPLVQMFSTQLNFELIHGASLQDNMPEQSRVQVLADLNDISRYGFLFAFLPLLSWLVSSKIGHAAVRRPRYDSTTKEPVGFSALVQRSSDAINGRQSDASGKEGQSSILKAWLSVPEDDKARMSNPQMSAECMNLVFAGRSSTSSALTAILHFLGTEQGRKWQVQIREELASAGDNKQIMPPALLAVFKETLRLHPPFPRGWPREVAKDAAFSVPGMDEMLPAGTMVYSSAFVVGRSKVVWGDDAEEWKPERWYDEEKGSGDAHTMDASARENGFVVFGRGSRACAGRDIAAMIILDAVRQVLKRWDVRAHGELRGVVDFEARFDECWVGLVARSDME